MRELDVVGVRVEMPSNQPIVLLREVGGDRFLPIWIGAVEATAIAFAQQGIVPPRPMTHDLFKDVLDAVGVTLEQVRITEVRDNTYYAELVLSGGVEISSRPSDSIALALRTGTPIYAAEPLLDEVGVLMADPDSDEQQEDEVARFRAFLEEVTPEDFSG
ncbi:bifunctional nuclease family protein [Jiangella asiatica]|uniref:Bifunctional nuclease family protein n=1 Tax=Jiangella asiatica TaxID=2530372 RepID=A0A4R5DJQ7_9ACTN|nr:bifunctional nuclease family protein [Jiangella asiatica]TDE12230.1 bifunctional nuclease family protein [Jiangella asiatica]